MTDLIKTATTQPATQYDFNGLIAAVSRRITEKLAEGVAFQVQTRNLQDVFLSGLLDEHQDHTCATCRGFFRRYGGLVSIDPATGKLTSLAWDESTVPEEYQNAVRLLRLTVEESTVRGVFYHEAGVHGVPATEGHPEFTHFHFEAEQGRYRKNVVAPLHRHMSKAREDYVMLAKSISEFPMHVLQDAEQLFGSDPLLGAATKHVMTLNEYLNFRTVLQGVTDRRPRTAIIWYHVANNYAGVVLIKNSVLGEFLQTLKEQGYAYAKPKFLKQTRGDTYQRPQAAPKAQNINAAEKRIEELGLNSALERRYAGPADIPTTEWRWLPTLGENTPKASVFDHLKEDAARRAERTRVNGGTITFDKFLRTVLPVAEEIELLVSQSHKYAFGGFITAVHPDAKPILLWDHDDGSIPRNPMSVYQYIGGTTPGHWGLGNRTKVIGLTVAPHQWHGREHPGQRKSWLLVLEKGKDSQQSGVGLFPEFLRKDLYEFRDTLEAYSARAELANPELSRAFVSIPEGAPSIGITLDVTVNNIVTMYNIDRWD